MLGSTGKSIKLRKASRLAHAPGRDRSLLADFSHGIPPRPVSIPILQTGPLRKFLSTGFRLLMGISLPTYR